MIVVRLPNGDTLTLRHRPFWADKIIPTNILFTIGDTIYVSNSIDLTSIPLTQLQHENKHSYQQADIGKWNWLLKYQFSKAFRLDQEAEAYADQIKHTVSLVARKKLLNEAAILLTSVRYGYCAETTDIAKQAIENKCSYTYFI